MLVNSKNHPKTKFKFRSKAFSLLKLSFVILIIGVLVVASEANASAQTSEMEDVMKYMSKKFNTKISPAGTTCNGVVTDGGCDVTSCSVTTANVVQSTVSQGSGSLTCSAGYSGSPTYTCTAGTFTPGGSACTAITCTITSVTGINNKTGLAYAVSATAIPSTPTSACASGYTGSPTYTCTATGAATIVSNCTTQGIAQFSGYKAWADDTYATSCNTYKNPSSGGHTYTGSTGDGVYRISPSGTPFDIYCDMTTSGGGWSLI